MTLVVAVDSNNDIFVGPDGSLATAAGLLAVLQACEHAAKTQAGEMVYAVDQGLPNFATIWNGSPQRSQFEAFLRRALLAVPDVLEVRELNTEVSGGVLSYRAVIKTIYGTGAVNA